MRRLGVRDAVDLDDGGSTTIVSRLPGHTSLTLLNHPADGSERRVANGIGLFETAPAIRPRPTVRRALVPGGVRG